jgi:glucose-6-phosphate isomerase
MSTRIELGEGGRIRFDWSKTHLDDAVIAGLRLWPPRRISMAAAQLFGGEKINNTEGRAAEHTAQRGVGRTPAWKKPRPCIAHGFAGRRDP